MKDWPVVNGLKRGLGSCQVGMARSYNTAQRRSQKDGGGRLGWEWGGGGFKLLQLQAKKRFLEMKYNRKSNAKERWISEITDIFLTPGSKDRYDSNEANYIFFEICK